MIPLTQSKNTTILPVLIALTLACFGLSPQARAVCQDACLTNSNTVQGEDALVNLTTGYDNTAIGFNALYFNTTGYLNTANGYLALSSNTTGCCNTANGGFALLSNTTGYANTAAGVDALQANTIGFNNTATGERALYSNTTGFSNTATGVEALLFNKTGAFNMANGSFALFMNTAGNYNTANGVSALSSNRTSSNNTATGALALSSNTANNNTATGFQALLSNTTGINNTANGVDALHSNTTGNYSTASGQGSLYFNTTGRNNTANGQNAMRNNTTGSFNIALGDNAGFSLTTGSNNIEIGNRGVAGEGNVIRIGKQGTQTATYIAGISGATVPTGVAVIVDSNGQLGTTISSARFKEAIKPMEKASEAILALQPVTFRYKHELDPKGIPQFGLVAEDVEKIDPDLVARDPDGKAYTVRYEAVNAMLLNEFLKEHRTVQELKSTVAKQEAIIAKQQKGMEAVITRLDEQTAQIQKVSAQLEASRRAQQTVVSNP